MRAIQNLYNKMDSAIKVRGGLSEEFSVAKGLRLGCCMAPKMFRIYLNEDLKTWGAWVYLKGAIYYTQCTSQMTN